MRFVSVISIILLSFQLLIRLLQERVNALRMKKYDHRNSNFLTTWKRNTNNNLI